MKNKIIQKKKGFTLVLSISLTVGLSLLGIAVYKMSQNFNNNIQSYNIKSNTSLKASQNLNNFINQWSIEPSTDIDSDDFSIAWSNEVNYDGTHQKLNYIYDDNKTKVLKFELLDTTISNNTTGEDISSDSSSSKNVKVYKLIIEGKDIKKDENGNEKIISPINTKLQSIIEFRD